MGRPKKVPPPSIGDNSALNSDEKRTLSGFIGEIERAEADKRLISEDISELYKSAKDKGFNVPALKAIIKSRRMEKEERDRLEIAIDAYKAALGMLVGTPLGDYVLAHTEAAQ